MRKQISECEGCSPSLHSLSDSSPIHCIHIRTQRVGPPGCASFWPVCFAGLPHDKTLSFICCGSGFILGNRMKVNKTFLDLAFMEPTPEETRGDRKDSCLKNSLQKSLSTIVLSAGKKKHRQEVLKSLWRKPASYRNSGVTSCEGTFRQTVKD